MSDKTFDNMMVIESFISVLSKIAEELETANSEKSDTDDSVPMLTIKESLELVPGVTDGTLRKLLKQGKIVCTRAGEGQHGKYLVNKNSLLRYFSENHVI